MLDLPADLERVAAEIVQAVGDVRRELGVGLVEAVYVECLVEELRARDLRVQREVTFPVTYRGRTLDRSVRVDLMIDERVLLEAKAVEALHPAHFAQFLTYLRLSGLPLGFLVNFSAVPLSDGIHRRVNTRSRT